MWGFTLDVITQRINIMDHMLINKAVTRGRGAGGAAHEAEIGMCIRVRAGVRGVVRGVVRGGVRVRRGWGRSGSSSSKRRRSRRRRRRIKDSFTGCGCGCGLLDVTSGEGGGAGKVGGEAREIESGGGRVGP